jgi:L-seryl-tRNA(Ser) seleniumtransferase
MGVYEELGVKPIINATGVFTRLSGCLMPAEVVQAMVEASQQFVCIEELQYAAGKVIAEITGAEAGYVCTGAYSGIVLSIAACITRLDPEKMNRLPNTEGMANEVIMEKAHRNSYDHAVEAAGGRIVEVGLAGGCQPGEMEAAINERTVAIFFFPDRPGDMLSLEEVVAIGHRHGVPVVVDGAGRLDEPGCLQSYVGTGADLVIFSGGKWMQGPQSTGIIAGRKDLISAIALQHLDMDVTPGVWTVPEELIPVSELPFIPRMGIGRGYKAGKEEIVGVVTALRMFAEKDHEAQREVWAERLQRVIDGLADVPHVEGEFLAAGVYRRGVPHARVRVDLEALGMTGREFMLELLGGDPPIHPIEREVDQSSIVINPWGLVGDAPEVIARRIGEIVAGG